MAGRAPAPVVLGAAAEGIRPDGPRVEITGLSEREDRRASCCLARLISDTSVHDTAVRAHRLVTHGTDWWATWCGRCGG